MKPNPVLLIWLGLIGAVGISCDLGRGSFDQTHHLFREVLTTHVTNGAVRYAVLRTNSVVLDQYLTNLAAVAEADFNRWNESDQLAFLINLYNASTLKLIIDHYPVSSVKNIGDWVKGPWKEPTVHAWGRILTLDDLEHGIIRARYREPRIHFALICGARGCPPFRSEPYVGKRLNSQLEDQGRLFLAEKSKNRLDPSSRIWLLSPVFKWYESDFTSKGRSVIDYASQFLDPVGRQQLDLGQWKVRYTDYDWSLNDFKPVP